MKFTNTFSALLVVLPLVAHVSGLTVPEPGLVSRQRGGFGGFGQKGQGGAGGAQAAAAAKASQQAAAAAAAAAAKGGKGGAAAASSTTAAAATATTAAAATGNNAAAGGAATGDPQSSTQIDPSVLQNTDDGQNPPVAGQSAAAVSQNNFANFCLLGLPKVPITNGLQTTTGSCNPTPIGNIPSTNAIPSAKFQSPTNGDNIAANTPFNVTLQAKNIQLGTFTNAQKTYFANPQTLNGQGLIIGHTHIVIEQIDSLSSTAVTDPTKFAFFKGVDDAADGQGNVVVPVSAGLPEGVYRVGTIMSSATHQPVIVPIAQHGLCDDVIYMTVGGAGAAAGNAAAAGGTAATGGAATGNAGAAAGTTAAAAATTSTAATAATGKGAAAAGGKAAGTGKGAKKGGRSRL